MERKKRQLEFKVWMSYTSDNHSAPLLTPNSYNNTVNSSMLTDSEYLMLQLGRLTW